MQKCVAQSRVGISLKNAPDTSHWTLNSYFGVFCTIWRHLGPFGCLTKLSAKRAELAQKFLARSRIIIFRNEHTRLTPFGPKLIFCCVLYCFGAFGTIWLTSKNSVQNGPKWCKSSYHEVASKFYAMNAPDPPHWTLTSSFGAFRTIRVHLGQFCCVATLYAKRPKLLQKFVQRSHVGIFRNKRTQWSNLNVSCHHHPPS